MSELIVLKITTQTFSAKVKSQEGNSPECLLKWLIRFICKDIAVL